MELSELRFMRRFAVNLYRDDLFLPAGEMSLSQNFVGDGRGDPYPVLTREGDARETAGDGGYRVEFSGGGRVSRFLCRHFAWYTYTLAFSKIEGAFASLSVGGLAVRLSDGGALSVAFGEKILGEARLSENGGYTFSAAFRRGGLAVYDGNLSGTPSLLLSLDLPETDGFAREDAETPAVLELSSEDGGRVALSRAFWGISGGIAQADIKPVRYEDGSVLMERGRVFLTFSARLDVGSYQGVMSWDPTLADFRLEGAIYFAYGDGFLAGDVATSLVFDRREERWLLWACAFSHGHILAHAAFRGDVRFGISVVDMERMTPAGEGNARTDFVGFPGDEDPDLILVDGRWHLAVCRVDEDRTYHYYHFVSDEGPTGGFRFVDRTPTGEKTGGLFVRARDGVSFVCGSDFSSRAKYDVYPLGDFSDRRPLLCDRDDGGFRGWGSVMLLPVGTRERYTWITFDRHLASKNYNWSYGNLYVFDTHFLK